MTVFLEEKGWSFTLVERTAERREEATARGVAVRMTFTGASEPALVVEDSLPGRHHYFLGNDASSWRSDVPLYASVRYRDVHPGVDVRAREHGGRFEYDLLLEPEADLEPVEIAVEGIEQMRIEGEGALVLDTRLGPVRMPAPLTWEEAPSGEKGIVTCRYVLRGENRFGFEVTGRRPGWALVVDPGLVWSTFVGGTQGDAASALALDAQGAATVAGMALSTSFPTTPGAFDTTFNGERDAFVTRLSPTGSSLVYSTFLGGTSFDSAAGLALDAQGGATIAGSARSTDFPTTPGAFDTTHNGNFDVFVARLSPTGSSLVYSTFLGGTDSEGTRALLVLDAQGAATVAGSTQSTDFPTTPGAFDTVYNGGRSWTDAFVARLSPTGSSLVYSTFLGGASYDELYALALDAQGAATVAASTQSTDFPTTPGAFDTTHNGNDDAFVTRLDMLPTGVSAFGRSSPGCTGPLAISVTSMPRIASAAFSLTCGNAPRTATGLLALTANRFTNPVALLGVEVWVDPSSVFLQLPATSNAAGASEVPLPIPSGAWLRGTTLYAQFFWVGATSPPPCPRQGISASHALAIVVQP